MSAREGHGVTVAGRSDHSGRPHAAPEPQAPDCQSLCAGARGTQRSGSSRKVSAHADSQK